MMLTLSGCPEATYIPAPLLALVDLRLAGGPSPLADMQPLYPLADMQSLLLQSRLAAACRLSYQTHAPDFPPAGSTLACSAVSGRGLCVMPEWQAVPTAHPSLRSSMAPWYAQLAS